jgi:hypothetical protein
MASFEKPREMKNSIVAAYWLWHGISWDYFVRLKNTHSQVRLDVTVAQRVERFPKTITCLKQNSDRLCNTKYLT